MTYFCRIALSLALGSLLLGQGSAQCGNAKSKDLVLENSHVRFKFEKGTMNLVEMTDLAGKRDHLAGGGAHAHLWEITFGRGTQRELVDNNLANCTFAHIDHLPDGSQRATMEWKDLVWYKEHGALTVRVTVELAPEDGVATWKIWVNNTSDYWGVWSLTFPTVTLASAGEYDIAEPSFSSGGRLLTKWKFPVQGMYPSGSWPMQFLAMNTGKDGIYLATEDPDGWAKRFDVNHTAGEVSLTHYPEGMGVPGSSFLDPYAIRFGVYQGDWTAAALRYKRWASRQRWAIQSSSYRSALASKKLGDVGFWIVYDFPLNDPESVPVGNLLQTLENLRTKLGVEIGVHWYRWNQATFDNQYPHFLPATPQFQPGYKELTSHGFLVMPYINGSSADLNIPDFGQFAADAVKDEAGGYRMHRYLDSSGRLLTMCPTSAHWRTVISHLTSNLTEKFGLNGLYIDQVTAMSPGFCFDASHGHPLGGGPYWTSATRTLMEGIETAVKHEGRDVAVISEAPNEPYLDLLDGTLTWQNMNGTEIPLFQMVYSGHSTLIGSPTQPGMSDILFRRTQGTALMDGRELGWVSFKELSAVHQDRVEYLQKILAYRKLASEYLQRGEMMQVLNSSASGNVFQADVTTSGHTSHLNFPAVEARVWRVNGKIGILFANTTDRKTSFTYKIDLGKLGETGTRFVIHEISPRGRTPLGNANSMLERTESLEGASMKFIEISPVATQKAMAD